MKQNATFLASVLNIQNNLMSFAMKLTLDHDDAHDLVQETTLKALNNQDKFVDNANFKGWMLTIMRNIFINNYRQAQRKHTVVDTTDDLYHINLTSHNSSETPDGSYATAEISRIINALPADYSQPFSMHIAGYKYDEIAQILGMPLGTVKSHIFFSRKRLREMLKDYR